MATLPGQKRLVKVRLFVLSSMLLLLLLLLLLPACLPLLLSSANIWQFSSS